MYNKFASCNRLVAVLADLVLDAASLRLELGLAPALVVHVLHTFTAEFALRDVSPLHGPRV